MSFNFESFKVDPKTLSLSSEEYCFKFAYDFYHTLSLCWHRSKRKVTKEYLTFLYRECMDSFMKVMHLSNYSLRETVFNKSYTEIKAELGKDIESLIVGFGVEIQLDQSSDLIAKMAGLYLVLETKHGITWGDIISYQGTQN